ncbi:carbon-nitrogen hydrolase family protein [Arthrobacter sp. NPDC056886]|uniref:carbon-nitrogen hydrolase family protein n=1 Tax=Arthrobacter sp. NPDC056886 TaxID=3345960 RepID=UPI0036713B47
MTLRIAAAQFAASPDKNDNRAIIASLVAQAAAEGARLVVLPENAMYSHPDSSTDLYPISESMEGEFASFVTETARTHKIWIVVGMTERIVGSSKVHNTLLAVDDAGQVAAHYRKVHLYDAFGYRESDSVEPGPIVDAATFDVDGVKVGLMTCYDLRFPESARRLADTDVRLIALPAAWVAGPMKEDHWWTLLRSRAIENTVYVIASGQTGPVCVGQSSVIDPSGVVLRSAGPQPGVITQTVSNESVDEIRKIVPVLQHRRFTVVERSLHE